MGTSRKEIRFWKKFQGMLARMEEPNRHLLFAVAPKMMRRQLMAAVTTQNGQKEPVIVHPKTVKLLLLNEMAEFVL